MTGGARREEPRDTAGRAGGSPGPEAPPLAFPTLGEGLDSIASSISDFLRGAAGPALELAERYRRRRGSMVRPGLLLASATLFAGGDRTRTQSLAEMVELIHHASVLHDECLLGAALLEEAGETTRPDGGRREAILLGDLLLARAFGLLAEHGTPRIVEVVSRITGDLAEGQLLEVQLASSGEGDGASREGLRRRVAELRTARFLGRCAGLGAEVAGAGEKPRRVLERYGEAMGFAHHLLRRAPLSPHLAEGARGDTDAARVALAGLADSVDVQLLADWTDRVERTLETLAARAG